MRMQTVTKVWILQQSHFGSEMTCYKIHTLVGGGVNPYFLIPASCSYGHIAHVWKDTWQHVRKDTF